MNKPSTTTNDAQEPRNQVEQVADAQEAHEAAMRGVAERVAALLRPISALSGRKRRFIIVKPRAGKVHIIGGDVLIL